MNDERAAIINLVLAGRLTPGDAARLLEALLELEVPEAPPIVEPPCPRPPWLEVDQDFDALLSREGCGVLIESATRKIAQGLAEGDIWRVISRLAMLDVAALARFWSEENRLGYAVGAVNVKETPEGLRGSGAGSRLYFSGNSVAHPIFSHPISYCRPAKPLVWEREEEVRPLAVTVHPEQERVSTENRTFDDCLRFTHRFVCAEGERTRTFWLARGVGLVRAVCERPDGSRLEVELVDVQTSGGESFFPSDPGSRWRFSGTDGAFPHHEQWRAVGGFGDGEYPWLSVAACPMPIED